MKYVQKHKLEQIIVYIFLFFLALENVFKVFLLLN